MMPKDRFFCFSYFYHFSSLSMWKKLKKKKGSCVPPGTDIVFHAEIIDDGYRYYEFMMPDH